MPDSSSESELLRLPFLLFGKFSPLLLGLSEILASGVESPSCSSAQGVAYPFLGGAPSVVRPEGVSLRVVLQRSMLRGGQPLSEVVTPPRCGELTPAICRRASQYSHFWPHRSVSSAHSRVPTSLPMM